MVKAGRKKWILKKHFQNLKKNNPLFYYQHLAVSLFLIIFWWPCNDQTKTFLWNSWNLEYIYFIWTLDILFMQYKLKKWCASFLFLKLMTTNYAHLLAKLNLKDNLSNKLQMQCVSTDLRIVWKRRHQTHLPLIIAFYHLWIIFLHIHQNCRLTSLQIGLNPLMEFAD